MMRKSKLRIFVFVLGVFFIFLIPTTTNAQDSPKDQRGTPQTIVTNIGGNSITLKNTGKYGVPEESVTNLSLRGSRYLIYEDSSGKAYYSNDTSNNGKLEDGSFSTFSQLYNKDGKAVFRIQNNSGAGYAMGNNDSLEILEDPNNKNPLSYSPVIKPGVTLSDDAKNKDDGITLHNTALSGDPNKPTVSYDPSSSPTYINDGTSICTPTGCEYTLMAPIGSLLGDSNGKYKIAKDDKSGLCQLLNGWWRIGIALAGMLAVVMIVLGGFQYATTDSLFDKSEGKGKIQNALWGLLLALTTWLVVNTINPALTNCDINAKSVTLSELKTTINTNGGTIKVNTDGSSGGESQDDIDAKYKKITDQWTTADDEKLKYGDKDATDKWNGIQTQIDALNNTYVRANQGGSYSGGSTSRDASWGSSDAANMNGKTVSGRQTYFSPDEKNTDSNTQAGRGALGNLVEGTSGGKNIIGQDLGTGDVVGSAASVYYPAGTLVEVNGIKYVVDDNNLTKTGSGTYVAKNQILTNNYTVDVFTRNNTYVNTGKDTRKAMTVLYVPTEKVTTAAGIADIRNNPSKYTNK